MPEANATEGIDEASTRSRINPSNGLQFEMFDLQTTISCLIQLQFIDTPFFTLLKCLQCTSGREYVNAVFIIVSIFRSMFY